MIKIETLFLMHHSYQTPDLIQISPLISGPRSNEESEVAVAACISLSPLLWNTFSVLCFSQLLTCLKSTDQVFNRGTLNLGHLVFISS